MITDNTAKWKAKKLSSLSTSNGIPVGFEYISMNPNVPQGSLPMFGGVYDRKVYADLWAWVQEQSGYLITDSEWQSYFNSNNGNVPFYSKGNGSTTFRVPSINCWVKGANGIEEVSSYLQAGLPNITGAFGISSPNCFWLGVQSTSGAFYADGSASNGYYGQPIDTQTVNNVASLNASRSNPIYGKSTTVQPESIAGMWLVKAYGTITNIGNVETSDILQAVDNSKITLAVW